ncbi:MAG: hypothetical protein ACMXYL_01310 [Candidatus Woesearchaeota archaeon]
MAFTKKGQVSIEAVSLTGWMVLFLVIGMGFFMMQFLNTVNEKDNEVAIQVAEMIMSELQMARAAEPGYRRTFFLPYIADFKNVEVYYPPTGLTGVILSPAEGRVVLRRADDTTVGRNILLGNDVMGALHNGNNTIIKTEHAILIIPENISGLIDARLPDSIGPIVAYANIVKEDNPISPLNVNSTVKCEYGIVNANPNDDLSVRLSYELTDSSGSTTTTGITTLTLSHVHGSDAINGIHYTDAVHIRDDLDNHFRGHNISCIIEAGVGTRAESESVPIVDSPPYIIIQSVSPQSSSHPDSEEFIATVEFDDYDRDDNSFNITFIAEGKNAGFLSCDSGCYATNLNPGTHTISFKYSMPPDIDMCPAYNQFGFKVKVENAGHPQAGATASHLETISC